MWRGGTRSDPSPCSASPPGGRRAVHGRTARTIWSERTRERTLFHPEGPTFWELAREALSSTERGYDLLAPKFDVTPFRTPDEIARAVARYLAEEPPRRVLDLCCGTGAMLEALRPVTKELLVGLDFSQGMLGVARRTGAPLVRANALTPPFKEAFDLVACFSALGHFLPREHRRLVRNVRGCLRPGGRFLFVTAEMPARTTPAYWVSRAFNAAMHVRNTLWSPPFVMYYLTFLLPDAKALLEQEGFEVAMKDLFPEPFDRYRLVDARRK
jgi:SAM-dependent methyltransferase